MLALLRKCRLECAGKLHDLFNRLGHEFRLILHNPVAALVSQNVATVRESPRHGNVFFEPV